MRINRIIAFTLGLSAALSMGAQGTRWNNEATDTLKINNLLAKAERFKNPQERVYAVAKEFLDAPYAAGTLESANGEALTVNLSQVDCTTLIDNIVAIGITAGEGRNSWRDFVYNLERIRYRGGSVNGYASRLHYISDWIVDNTHRGNFEEVTNRSDLATYEVKTIDFMSQNRELYPALSDSATYVKVKEMEIGYRSHRYPMIKTQRVAKAAKTFLRTGDIVALCTGKKGLDVSHMGIVVIDEKGVAHLLHASSKKGRVTLDSVPLERYLTQNRLSGIRVIRLKE